MYNVFKCQYNRYFYIKLSGDFVQLCLCLVGRKNTKDMPEAIYYSTSYQKNTPPKKIILKFRQLVNTTLTYQKIIIQSRKVSLRDTVHGKLYLQKNIQVRN